MMNSHGPTLIRQGANLHPPGMAPGEVTQRTTNQSNQSAVHATAGTKSSNYLVLRIATEVHPLVGWKEHSVWNDHMELQV